MSAAGPEPAAGGAPRVVLVETSDALPGLLPFQAWDALATADVVVLRDPDAHPSAEHLHFAGLDLERVVPAALERGDLDLTRPGDPTDRRIAKALLDRAADAGTVVYLPGPDDAGLAPALAGVAPDHDAEIELVLFAQQPPGAEVLRLVEVMRRLRDPETGCPWDLEQDHASLVRYLVEETYELVDAIEDGRDTDVVEELGDVLLQVVFHAQVAHDRDAFTIDDVARGIAGKLERRHPHVFAEGEAATPAEVQANWDRLKAGEKTGRTGPFDGVPTSLPGLALLEQLQGKAAREGFDQASAAGSIQLARAALDQLEGGSHDPVERDRELGGLLEAVVALARHLNVDADAAARAAARRVRVRVEAELA